MHFSAKLALRTGILSVAAASAIVIPASAAFAAAPSLTVTPNTGLTNGQSVTVTGSNFPASTPYFLSECSGLGGAAQCDAAHAQTGNSTAADGTINTTFSVRTGPVGTGSCNPGSSNCFLVATTDPNAPDPSTNTAFQSIAFANVPTITVTPDKGVKNGQNVSVSGKHFPSNMTIYVVECGGTSGQQDCDISTLNASSQTNGSGSFSGVKVKVHTGQVGDKKCKPGGQCFIAASTSTSGDLSQSAAAPFKFAKASSKVHTKTTAKAKGSKVLGKVKAGKKGVKGLKVLLDMKHGKHWKKVDSSKTKKGGKFHFSKLSSGKYEVKTPKQHKGGKTYGASHSKPVRVKAGGGSGGGANNCPGCTVA